MKIIHKIFLRHEWVLNIALILFAHFMIGACLAILWLIGKIAGL